VDESTANRHAKITVNQAAVLRQSLEQFSIRLTQRVQLAARAAAAQYWSAHYQPFINLCTLLSTADRDRFRFAEALND